MANTTLHLGLDWHGSLIGTFWGSYRASADSCFLQYALADASGAPAWFRFTTGDVMSVVLWDLTKNPPPADPGNPKVPWSLLLSVGLGFEPLDGASASTLNPSTLVSASNGQVATQAQQGQLYLQLSASTMTTVPPGVSCPWGDAIGHYSAGTITFTTAASFKLSYYVSAAPPGGYYAPQIYLSDPEVIVGSRGGGPS